MGGGEVVDFVSAVLLLAGLQVGGATAAAQTSPELAITVSWIIGSVGLVAAVATFLWKMWAEARKNGERLGAQTEQITAMSERVEALRRDFDNTLAALATRVTSLEDAERRRRETRIAQLERDNAEMRAQLKPRPLRGLTGD